MSQWVKCVMCKQDALCLNPRNLCESWTYSGNICNPSTTVGRWSAEDGDPWKLTGHGPASLVHTTGNKNKVTCLKWSGSQDQLARLLFDLHTSTHTHTQRCTHTYTAYTHAYTLISGMVTRMWNSSVWEAEMGDSQFQGPCREFEMTLGYIVRLSPQKEKKKFIAILVKVLLWPVFSVDGQITIYLSFHYNIIALILYFTFSTRIIVTN